MFLKTLPRCHFEDPVLYWIFAYMIIQYHSFTYYFLDLLFAQMVIRNHLMLREPWCIIESCNFTYFCWDYYWAWKSDPISPLKNIKIWILYVISEQFCENTYLCQNEDFLKKMQKIDGISIRRKMQPSSRERQKCQA